MDGPRFSHAIVRPPGPNFADGLTAAGLGRPDHATALAQHARYCEALEACGLELTRLAPDPRFPDATFVEDTAVLAAGLAVVTRPGAPSRAGETESVREALARLFLDLEAIREPGTVDGGDVCEAGEHVFVGLSHRTNAEGARQLALLLESVGFTHTVVDVRGIPGLLHLKSGLAWLGGRRLLAREALARHLAFTDWEMVPVPPGEEYAANCVLLNGRLLLPAGFPRLEAALRAPGCEPLPLEMSEFRKMDGGPSCLSLRF